MKKIWITFATAVAMICLCATAAFAMPTEYQTTNSDVNLRFGPGTGYGVICVVPRGTQVYINEADNGSGWTYVSYNNTVGYLCSTYLGSGSSGSGSAYVGGGACYTTAAVNMRSGPSTGYSVYTVVPAGATVYIDGTNANGWTHVSYGNYSGYVSSSYLSGNAGSSSVSSGSANYNGGTTWYNGSNYANVYDYNYYMRNNQDLVAVLGTDPNALIQHFVNFGMDEGRQAISSFNVYAYMDQHYDLYQRFGNNLRCYYLYACGLM